MADITMHVIDSSSTPRRPWVPTIYVVVIDYGSVCHELWEKYATVGVITIRFW